MKDLEPYSWLQKRAEMYSSVSECDFSDLKKVDFHFESFIFPPFEPKIENGHFYEAGLFSLFLGENNGAMIYAMCDIKDFRTNLYNAICDFAERQKTSVNAVRDWAWYIYDQKILGRYKEGEECDDEEDNLLARKMMLDNLRSRIIEKYIQGSKKKQPWPAFWRSRVVILPR